MAAFCRLLSLGLPCFVLIVLLAGCTPGLHSAAVRGARLRVLGTVQDGGLPHAGCWCDHCERARRDLQYRRFVSSVALLLPGETGIPQVFLIDVSPDIREQLHMLGDVRKASSAGAGRDIVDGVFLTHAHIGHYLGLAFFGFEAMNTRDLPVSCTPRMAGFLRANGPWSQLVRLDNIRLREVAPGAPVDLPVVGNRYQVSVKPIQVPHRDEYSDTVGYVIRRTGSPAGSAAEPGRTVFYVPDTEPWRNWKPSLAEVIEEERIDTLLVDGTFYSSSELPGRSVTSIGHPLMTDSMDLLEPLVRAARLTVYFTHLNHSNPVLDPASAAARDVTTRGFHVAREGLELPL
jgi:pyrroloquinoline quinone biosynthesis protein B